MRQSATSNMARKSQQSMLQVRDSILNHLEQSGGATEAEIAAALGIERRTANNYLNDCLRDGLVGKDGTVWICVVSKIERLERLIAKMQSELQMEIERRGLEGRD